MANSLEIYNAMKINNFSDRLRQAIGSKGDISINAFAKKCGIGESLLRKYISGDSLPGITKVTALSKAANVTLDWLITGRGPMHSQDLSDAYPIDGYREDDGWVTFPIYSARAAAGYGRLNEPGTPTPGIAFDPELSSYLMRVPSNALAGMYVSGDSMEPTFGDGDVLILDISVEGIIGDDIYVFIVDEGCIVKRVTCLTDGRLVFKSDNPSYADEIIYPEKKSYLKIYGRVVAAVRRF